MASLEARLPGWTPVEFPLHAFSLTSSHARAKARRARETVWRQMFGELWSQAVCGDLIAHHADPPSVGIRAKRHFRVVQRDLLALWEGADASRRSVLRSAVVPLECSARVWQTFGPVAGRRHLHLLRRLDETLAKREREIRAAELPLAVNRATVSLAARTARDAIDDLLGATVDRAEALAALEDAAVEFASLAVRIAANLNAVSGARRGYPQPPPTLRCQLEALVAEVSAAAQQRRAETVSDAQEDHLGMWLSRTLGVAFPGEAIALAGSSSGDPCLRADARCSLRACWLELTVGLWVIVQALDDLLALETFGDQERLKGAVSSRAGIALMTSGLCQSPHDFDHLLAWKSHHEALCALVGEVCLALQTREPDATVRAQQLALRRLARALAAIWTVDESVRSPVPASWLGPRERRL